MHKYPIYYPVFETILYITWRVYPLALNRVESASHDAPGSGVDVTAHTWRFHDLTRFDVIAYISLNLISVRLYDVRAA